MLYCSTGELEAIHPDLVKRLKRLDMTVCEAEEAAHVIKHIRAIRTLSEHGNGEICIPIANGVLNKIRTTFVDFFQSGKKPKSP